MADQKGLFSDADVIHTYTREDALEDGVLIDVTEMAKEANFVIPVAITQALHARLQPNEIEKGFGQSYEGRLWDVLYMASLAATKAKDGQNHAHFKFLLAEGNNEEKTLAKNEIELLMVIGPGDNFEPVITIGFSSDF